MRFPTRNRSMLAGLVLAAVASLQSAFAADVAPLPVAPVQPSDLLSVGTGLVLVIAAVLAFAFIYSRTQGLRGGNSDVINVLASKAVGPKERIMLVEVANTQLVIGMTSSNVQTLHIFEQPISVEQNEKSGFAERLRGAMRGGGK